MRNQRLARALIICLTSAGFASATTAAVSAAPQANKSCSKLGSKAAYKKVIYLCVKNGKKLSWQKQTPAKPAAIPTPKPIPFDTTPTTQLLEVDKCRLQTVDAKKNLYGGISSGFPNLSALHGKSVINALALYVDFPDRLGTEITFSKDRYDLEQISAFYRDQSYGTVDVVWSATEKYAHMPRSISSYNLNNSTFQTTKNDNTPFLQDAISAADQFVDYSRFDLVVVMPPNTATYEEFGSYAGTRSGLVFKINSQEGQVKNIQTFLPAKTFYGTSVLAAKWGGLLHEIAHELGLVDYYNYAATGRLRDAGRGTTDPVMHIYDPMGDEWSNTGSGFLGWSRFQLGFLSDQAVRCASGSIQTFHEIHPIAFRESETKATFIVLDSHRLLAFEYRLPVGYDKQLIPGQQGLIAYIVDTSRNTGEGPTRLLFPAGRTDEKSPSISTTDVLYVENLEVRVVSVSSEYVRFSVTPRS